MKKLLWLDLEMTGLNVDKEYIIEAAGIVTDSQFNSQGQFHFVVKAPDSVLEQMDEWNKKHHGESGLLNKVPQGMTPAEVEQQILKFIGNHFNEPVVLAGNSIGQDRLFIRKHWPLFEEKLHYRMLDVTSFKIVFELLKKPKFQKQNKHQALEDILESIAELKYYLKSMNFS